MLTELAFGTNILQNELAGNHKYIFNPNKKMLKLSYEWMKQAGLMTKDEKITKYGYDVLRFPLSVFNGRILLESIDNGVASDIIPMISIIENKGFLTKEFNIKKFGKNVLKREYSDLEVYTKLFEILTSKEIDEDILKMFIGLGIKPGTIDYFRSIQPEEKFYKVLGKELEEVGIKLKNIERIDETVEKIKLYLESNKKYQESLDLEIDNEEKKVLIQKSLLSGNLHNIYTSLGKNMFEMWGVEKNDLEFEQSDTSFLDIGHGDLYIGDPFIIGGSGEKDDKPILSFITSIEAGDIEYFESKEYEEYTVQNNINTGKKQDKILIDSDGDTGVIPKQIKKTEDKQKYLALNWLPYFLIEKNEFFKKYIEQLGNNYNKDKFIEDIQKITLDLYRELDAENKQKNIEKFLEDRKILELLLRGNNFNDKNPKQDITKKVLETVEGNGEFFNYIKAINNYNKILEKSQDYIEKNKINISKIENEKLDEFIKYLEENNGDYSKLLILLKNIIFLDNKQKSKQDFVKFNRQNKKLIKFKKRDSWLISFLDNLKRLQKGKNINIKDFNIGTFNDKKLISSDPIIKKNNLGNKSEELNKKLKNINKLSRKIGLDEKMNGKLNSSLQKLLFSDNKKYNRGINNFNEIIISIKEEKEKNLIEIEELKINKNGTNSEENNKKIKIINILNSNIDLLLKKLNTFKEEVLEIREKINNVNFDDIIFNKNNKNSVYTKKFLYTTLIDIIFEGNFVAIKNNDEERLKERLRKKLKGNKENIDIDELLEVIKNKQKNTKKGNKDKQLENKLQKNIKNFQNILNKNKTNNLVLEEEIKNNYKNIFSLLENIKNIMLDFYPKEILELNENKILNFAKKIHNLDFNTFDNELKNLIKELPLSQSPKYNEIFKKLEEYKDLYDYITNLEKKESSYSNEENEEIDFIGETENINNNIEELKQKMQKINEIVNK